MRKDRERERNEKLNDDVTRWIFQDEYPELWAYDDKIIIIARRHERGVQDNIINQTRPTPGMIYIFVTTNGRAYHVNGWAFGEDTERWRPCARYGPGKLNCPDYLTRHRGSLVRLGFRSLGIRAAA